MRKREQVIAWRRLDLPGYDACSLWSEAAGWRLTGTAIFAIESRPCHLNYCVDCDRTWQTRAARITGCLGRKTLDLTIAAMPGRKWALNGTDYPACEGCVDLDLGFTPASNLIPVRRLDLRIGQAAEAPAAYLDFPVLALGRLEQRYQRQKRDAYGYRAPGAGYAASLRVSSHGFIIDYPGLWELAALD